MCHIKQKYVEGNELSFLAAASLITPGVVLTIAHWVIDFTKSPSDLVVTCGDIVRLDAVTVKDITVEKIVIHPGFTVGFNDDFDNDFGLLILKEQYSMQKENVICLPTQKDFEDFDHENCIATGWGKKAQGGFNYFNPKTKLPKYL